MLRSLDIETHYKTKDIVIAISQSGETADTMAAIKLAKEHGAFVFGVCNVVGSSISRETHAGAYTCGS
jgi:glucosamine--fructose-6-phosphate aminotransferase (isomerizing)